MKFLEDYGWNLFRQQNTIEVHPDHLVGRVISIKGFKYELITERGVQETELSGKLLYGTQPENLPKVGDWVSYLDYGDLGYIVDVLPRANSLARKNPGNKTERQILGANIDYALITQGLDRDFNMMRLERYITQVVACGISPVVILNKVDLIQEPEAYRDKVLRLQQPCQLFFCSTLTGNGIDALKSFFEKGKTYIMFGSSGVGKSSLLNIFMNESLQQTNTVSDVNNKGRHTTTTRELFQLPGGGLLMDTPGMREFGVTDDLDSVTSFPALDEFVQRCRYADCKHVNEPGCAVVDALQSGALDPVVYESYIKLMK
jgi:ribosome biogenesis GTPase